MKMTRSKSKFLRPWVAGTGVAIMAMLVAVAVSVPGFLTAAGIGPSIDASKTDVITDDVDGDGKADPGDTITYTVIISNSGNTDANGVSFTDTINANTTLVGGSVKTTPLALDDAYNATGNVQISVPMPGVLGNDTDPDGGALTAIAIVGGSSTNGGDVDLFANGSFTYDPKPGFEGPDSFDYTIQDADGNNDTATVTITVSGMVWFVDDSQPSGGDGRLTSPFDCLVGSGCFDPEAADDAGDNIFVRAGTYNGGLTLLNNQKLIGDGSSSNLATVAGITLAPNSVSIVPFSGTDPSVAGSVDVISVGQNNTIRGLTLSSGTGTGIRGTNVGTLSVSETTLSGGGAMDINGGTLAVSLDDLSASSSTDEGIRLASVTGTFSIVATTGTIDINNFAAVDITGTGGGVFLNVTLTSVTSIGGSTAGIGLDTTTGSFTVTGSGTAGSGGTISDKTGVDGTDNGIGVLLSDASSVSLSRMEFNDFTNFAIRGSNVAGFDLLNSVINGPNGTSAAHDEGSVSFSNLTGASNFTNNTISGGLEENLRVVNTSGTLNRLTVSGGTIGLNSTSLGNDGVFVESQGSATLNVTVEDVLFLGARGDLLQTNTLGNSTMDIVVQDNIFENAHTNIVSGGGGVTLSGGSGGSNITVTYDVSGTSPGSQTFRDAKGNALTINYLNGAGTASGIVENNDIGVTAVPGSGSATQSGMLISSGGSLTHTVTINNNDVRSIAGFAGLDLSANSTSTLNATVTNNTIDELSGFVLTGMYLLAGGGGGDTSTLCADIQNNTVDASGVSFASSVFFDQVSVSANHNLPGYTGSPHGEFGSPSTGTASVDIESYLLGRGNSLTAGASAFFDVEASLVQGVTGSGASCPLTAALGQGPGGVDLLSKQQLAVAAAKAIEHWSAHGVSRAGLIRLQRAIIEIVDLPDGELGSTSMMRISIDHNGAGYGWSHGAKVDGKMDLLTVVLHEMGHVLGKTHVDAPDLMANTLPTGVRRLATEAKVGPKPENASPQRDRVGLGAGNAKKRAEVRHRQSNGPQPASAVYGAGSLPMATSVMAAVLGGGLGSAASGETVSLNIGTLPPGKSIKITFDVTLDGSVPSGTLEICNQGVVSGDNFSDELTDDPNIGGVADPTCTDVEVPLSPDPLEDADDGLGGDYNRVGDFKMPTSAVAGSQEVAIRVTLNRMYIDTDEDASQCPVRQGLPDLQAFEGQVRYLGPPEVFDNNALTDPKWVGAKLQCAPLVRDWSASALAAELGISEVEARTIYYYGAEVVPCSIHDVQQATQSCVDSANEDCFSDPLEVRTALWGDIWPIPGGFGAAVNFGDIGIEVDAFKSIPFVPGDPPSGAPNKWRSMLRENEGAPNETISFTDISKCVEAFKTIGYEEVGPTACP